jgi:hypothetical protein
MKHDVVRQTAVAVSAIIAVVGSMIGVGLFGGTPIREAAGGVLSPDATVLAPASSAFSIWTPIYLGLVGFAGWQLRPAQRSNARQRALGPLVAVSMLLNAAWILAVQVGWVTVSVVVIAALLAVLILAYRLCCRWPPSGPVDALVVDTTIGLYLGWVCVAVCANLAAALAAAQVDPVAPGAILWALVALAAVTGLGGWLVATGRGRLAPAAALAWGLSWIGVARLGGQPESVVVAVAALAAAVVLTAFALSLRLRHRTAIPA